MKKWFLFVLFFSFLISTQAFALTFAWDYDGTEPEIVSGYKIYCSKISGEYSAPPIAVVPRGTFTATVEKFPYVSGTKLYFVATAYGDNVESGYSNEISYVLEAGDVGIPNPINFKLVVNVTLNMDGTAIVNSANIDSGSK
ncbi:MAG: hypothetical protein RBR32_03595 [Bacteroidales bacterium]|nr:hypothetical protein [Bacteroidales bacterium]